MCILYFVGLPHVTDALHRMCRLQIWVKFAPSVPFSDARIGGCRMYGRDHPSYPVYQTPMHQKKVFVSVNLSLLHFTQDIQTKHLNTYFEQ